MCISSCTLCAVQVTSEFSGQIVGCVANILRLFKENGVGGICVNRHYLVKSTGKCFFHGDVLTGMLVQITVYVFLCYLDFAA